MHIELKHLRTLIALRDFGSLAKAAQQLHLTQSALSHQLNDIEHRLDLALVHRRSRPIQFTHAGQRLITLAQTVLPQIDTAELELQQMVGGKTGRLHIAIECHSCVEWLMPTIDVYRTHWPEVELDLSLSHSFDPMSVLSQGQLDMVITTDEQEISDIEFLPLFRYQAVLVMSNDNPLTQQAFIEAEHLQDQTLVTYPVDQSRLDIFQKFLNPANIKPAHVRTAELTLMMLQLIASNRGVAALPSWAVHDQLDRLHITTRPLTQHGFWGTLFCAIRKNDLKTLYIKEFIQTAVQTSFQHLPGIEPVE